MRAKRIHIKNILGIEELEIEPGKVTVVSGGNGVGKTSVIEALRATLGGGNDATLLRNGSEQGEVVLELDDGMEIRKTVTENGSDLQLRHPTFGKVSKPQTVLNQLHDALSLNPVEFLTAKDPAKLLLEAVPMALDVDALKEAVEPIGMEVGELDPDAHALEVIGMVRKTVYDKRRDANAVVRRLKETLEELRGSVAEGLPAVGDLQDVIATSADLIEEARAARDASRATLRVRGDGERRSADEKRDAAINTARAERDRIVAEANEAFEEVVRLARDEHLGALKEIQAAVEEASEAIAADFVEQSEQAAKKKAAAEAQLEAARANANTLQMIAYREDEIAKAETEAAALNQAMQDLGAIGASAASSIPIAGVIVQEGGIEVGGVPWVRVNAAERVRVAVEVAKLRAGDLRLILVDGLEQLDPEHFRAMTEALATSDCDAIVTRVTEGALHVEANI